MNNKFTHADQLSVFDSGWTADDINDLAIDTFPNLHVYPASNWGVRRLNTLHLWNRTKNVNNSWRLFGTQDLYWSREITDYIKELRTYLIARRILK